MASVDTYAKPMEICPHDACFRFYFRFPFFSACYAVNLREYGVHEVHVSVNCRLAFVVLAEHFSVDAFVVSEIRIVERIFRSDYFRNRNERTGRFVAGDTPNEYSWLSRSSRSSILSSVVSPFGIMSSLLSHPVRKAENNTSDDRISGFICFIVMSSILNMNVRTRNRR